MVLRSFVCSCDSAVRLLDSENQANVDYCYVRRREETRREHFARPWTQTSKPTLTDSSLAAKRRAEALYVLFVLTEHPSPAR